MNNRKQEYTIRNRKWSEKVSRLAVLSLLAAGAVGFPLLSNGAMTHRWSFNDGTANDSVGTAHGTLYGTATISGGRLQLSGSSGNNRMETTAGSFGHTTAFDKTLVAWFTLTNAGDNSPDGGPLGIENSANSVFDSIVYGESIAGQWMNGSDMWYRTPGNNGGVGETLSEPNQIMMAITYSSAGANRIKLYRNGELYAQHDQVGSMQTYDGNAKAVIGPRVGTTGYMNGYINEARIYDTALTASEIATLYAQGPNLALQVTVTVPANGQQFPAGSSVTGTVTVARGTAPYTVTYYMNGAEVWTTNNASTNLFTIPLGVLAVGTYTNYATVTDSVSSNATSSTNTFTVVPRVGVASGWSRCMPITFMNDVRLNTLTNFPALVVLDTNKVDYSQFQANGQDLRFVDANGYELAYEVESWNTTSNSSIWVKVPTMTAGCTITAYWGNVSAPLPSYTTNGATWSQGYSCVWHFKGAAGDLGKDSGTNANHLSTATGSPSYSSSGRTGGALYLDGSSTMNKGGVFPAGVPTGSSAYTHAAWVKADTGCDLGGGWLGWGNGATSQGNNIRLDSANNKVWEYWYLNDMGGTLPSGTFFDGYHFVVNTWDGTTEIIYLDGVNVNSRTPSAPNVGAANFVVGKTVNAANFKGWVDELLIASSARSSNWIWACFMNQASNSVFSTAGAVEDLRPQGTLISFF
jgi:hypothetical protein